MARSIFGPSKAIELQMKFDLSIRLEELGGLGVFVFMIFFYVVSRVWGRFEVGVKISVECLYV